MYGAQSEQFVNAWTCSFLQAENLPPPWGDCATKELVYYKRYIHSRCLRECETKQIVKACTCRDAYMPGFSVGG